MGNNIYKEYNNENNMSINIELNKVCYFPEESISGSITLFPKQEIIDSLMEYPELVIRLEELQQYAYKVDENTNDVMKKFCDLIKTQINLKDSLSSDYSSGIKIPFSFEIPNNATFYSYSSDFVRHFFIVEVPICESKRAKAILIKNIFPKTKILKNIEEKQEFNKTKSLSKKKCSVSCNIKLPKNYFFYDEEIPFEINIDCSNLDLKIKSIKVFLDRKENLNYNEGNFMIMTERSSEIKEINYKKIKLEKGLSNYNIVNSINFPITSAYPPKIYEESEKHGLFEVNDVKINKNSFYLYPSNLFGLLSVEYYLKFKLHFDSLRTSDEIMKIPIYFSENNSCNPVQCID